MNNTDDTNKETLPDYIPNCLALTIRKDYNLTIAKNLITNGYEISLKILFSSFVLNLVRMFL